MYQYAITTADNPYHPVDELEKWLTFDHDHGYYTDQRLAKLCPPSPSLTDEEQEIRLNYALKTMLRLDGLGIYTLVPLAETNA